MMHVYIKIELLHTYKKPTSIIVQHGNMAICLLEYLLYFPPQIRSQNENCFLPVWVLQFRTQTIKVCMKTRISE